MHLIFDDDCVKHVFFGHIGRTPPGAHNLNIRTSRRTSPFGITALKSVLWDAHSHTPGEDTGFLPFTVVAG